MIKHKILEAKTATGRLMIRKAEKNINQMIAKKIIDAIELQSYVNRGEDFYILRILECGKKYFIQYYLVL
jgi:hypothetical protein